MWLIVLGAVLGPFLLSIVATWAVRRWSWRTGFLDRPGGHKQHNREVALGGGIAIAAAIVLPLIIGTLVVRWGSSWFPEVLRVHRDGIVDRSPLVLAIVGGAIVLHILGLIDDRKPLGAASKFAVQFLVAGWIVIFCKVRALQALPESASIALTVFWIVVITNAFNFLDNMDGLAAGVGAVAAAIFAVSAMMAGQIFVPVMAWIVVGALLGFLGFNFAPASVFMGDSGSLVIGYFLAVLTVLTTFYDPDLGMQPFGVLVPLAVLAVPLYDVVSVCVIRLRAGDSPFRGDRRHFSHRLVKRGMSVRVAVLTIYLATATTGLSALLLPQADWPMALLAIVQCLCVVAMIALLEYSPIQSADEGPLR